MPERSFSTGVSRWRDLDDIGEALQIARDNRDDQTFADALMTELDRLVGNTETDHDLELQELEEMREHVAQYLQSD
jgi:hypothetical protein